MVIYEMPIPHIRLSLSLESHILFQSSIHCLMTSHCVLSHELHVCSNLAILSTVWYSCAMLHGCCLTFLCIPLLLSRSALGDSEHSALSIFKFIFSSHCLLTATKVLCVILPKSSPAIPLASPAYSILISVSIGDSPILPALQIAPC